LTETLKETKLDDRELTDKLEKFFDDILKYKNE
jgi:hypothetical protein